MFICLIQESIWTPRVKRRDFKAVKKEMQEDEQLKESRGKTKHVGFVNSYGISYKHFFTNQHTSPIPGLRYWWDKKSSILPTPGLGYWWDAQKNTFEYLGHKTEGGKRRARWKVLREKVQLTGWPLWPSSAVLIQSSVKEWSLHVFFLQITRNFKVQIETNGVGGLRRAPQVDSWEGFHTLKMLWIYEVCLYTWT